MLNILLLSQSFELKITTASHSELPLHDIDIRRVQILFYLGCKHYYLQILLSDANAVGYKTENHHKD